jgi:uncharacterized protein (DUF697 family)/GTP-binding protein EngB required for normal cell division
MDIFSKLRDTAPDELLDLLNQVLRFFPAEFQFRLQQVIATLPDKGENLHKILGLVRGQWEGIQSEDNVRIAIVGPSQTGKASILEAIKSGQYKKSPAIFSVVDTTGLNEFLGYDKSRNSPQLLDPSDVVVLLLDSRYEISSETQSLVERLRLLDRPLLIALNKADLIENPARTANQAQKKLGHQVLTVSAFQKGSINRLLRAIVTCHQGSLYPLARSFPEFRSAICAGIVNQASIACGLAGAITIPVSDFLPITAIQTAMLLKLARAFGHPLDRQRARELIPMLASGIVIRKLGHRLRGNRSQYDSLIGATAAGGWTLLLGRAAISYFGSSLANMKIQDSQELHVLPKP